MKTGTCINIQYKINLRIIYINSLLLKCIFSETELLFETKETRVNLFYECPILVRSLCLQFVENIHSMCDMTKYFTSHVYSLSAF